MTSKSLWIEIDFAPDAEVLDGVQECNVAVIGSGIAGISTAHELCQRGKNFVTENITALKSFAEYVAPGEVTSLDDLKPGKGAIIRRGLEKLAASRDEAGTLHRRSASCTHVGCHLHWNSFETCRDCPCHGSMFNVDGQPINAPAIGPLARVED